LRPHIDLAAQGEEARTGAPFANGAPLFPEHGTQSGRPAIDAPGVLLGLTGGGRQARSARRVAAATMPEDLGAPWGHRIYQQLLHIALTLRFTRRETRRKVSAALAERGYVASTGNATKLRPSRLCSANTICCFKIMDYRATKRLLNE
jgi:hypothetical protein